MLRRLDEPGVLAEARPRLTNELEKAWRHKRSRGPDPDPLLQHPDVVAPLVAMTMGTCAYCERPLAPSGSDAAVVTHHRPPWGAVGTDGAVDLRAYWWLTYEWTNLFPPCTDCVRTRGSRFPVIGARIEPGGDPDQEDALLLNPETDDLDLHLRYGADGRVSALSERGRVSLDLLSLNRESLVQARRQGQADVRPADEPAFTSMRRQLDREHPMRSLMAGPTLAPSSGAEPGRPEYFQAARWIERLVIQNFRPIRHLDIDLTRSTSERGPWTVLLGENGSGKSSILHAIALTMMGGDQRRRLDIDARSYLRQRARRGLVQVYLSGSSEPLELRWGSGDVEFSGPEEVPALMLGYGATRLLPRHGNAEPDRRLVRVDNLFDPLLPLTDPTWWLLSLDDEVFDDVAEGIGHLLALDADEMLVRRRGTVWLRRGRDRSEITALSDGYQSMVVMSCDILSTVLSLWPQPALAEGIVLIDEIGAHLHPRWRMRIVGALRSLMPRVQFVVTTHEPLCLRGVADGEVVVVRRNSESEVVALTDLPPVTGMRIDQLLTSEHFGLGSTDDPEVADLWQSYYALQGAGHLTAERQAELERVRRRLEELQQFGTTERDRLLLDSAARYIAERRETGDAVARAPAEVTAHLATLWSAHLPGGQ
ncbi:AAA family ATPase [Tessaracoccus sp. SD287]|uniref:AAA family ATPase n=1 Tax=Tessaracoccus sp. SD287 TaxID=2782008 RepID=UPI001A96D066|nr:AAA family ATPase [Tessaracoccus sp. SD287]MBO1032334.1 AAA family ATPase [Tessaracoccus sp. SD287]